jgi:hypothetical protein
VPPEPGARDRRDQSDENGPGAGTGPGEWPALYAQYLLRAASQSTRASQLYQEVFDGLARGELPPTVFREVLPDFTQTRGPLYTTRLAETTSRFFASLIELNAAASHDLLTLLLPEEDATDPEPPPAFDPANPIVWYQQLTAHAASLNRGALARYQTLLERVAAGDLPPARVQEVASEYLERRLPDQINGLGALFFDLLNGLNDLRVEYEEDYLTGVLGRAVRPGQQAPPALDVVAPLGGTASTSLQLTNTRAVPALVHCEVTDVRRADGVGPAFDPPVSITPGVLEIPPEGNGVLSLTWELREAEYEPDALYVGAVRIDREGEPRLEIPLRIRATAPEPPVEPAPARAPGKRGRSKPGAGGRRG